MNDFSSQAGLSSFRGGPAPAPLTVHVAVIEWPADLGEPPVVILDRNRDNLMPQLIAETRKMCAAIASDSTIMPEFREAFAANPADLMEHVFEYDGPFITFHEQEV